MEVATEHEMGNGLQVRFRPIKPSDEEAVRRFFYRFSKEAVYSRFFFPISTMPHDKVMHAIELLGTKVAPVVKAEIAKRTAAPVAG